MNSVNFLVSFVFVFLQLSIVNSQNPPEAALDATFRAYGVFKVLQGTTSMCDMTLPEVVSQDQCGGSMEKPCLAAVAKRHGLGLLSCGCILKVTVDLQGILRHDLYVKIVDHLEDGIMAPFLVDSATEHEISIAIEHRGLNFICTTLCNPDELPWQCAIGDHTCDDPAEAWTMSGDLNACEVSFDDPQCPKLAKVFNKSMIFKVRKVDPKCHGASLVQFQENAHAKADPLEEPYCEEHDTFVPVSPSALNGVCGTTQYNPCPMKVRTIDMANCGQCHKMSLYLPHCDPAGPFCKPKKTEIYVKVYDKVDSPAWDVEYELDAMVIKNIIDTQCLPECEEPQPANLDKIWFCSKSNDCSTNYEAKINTYQESDLARLVSTSWWERFKTDESEVRSIDGKAYIHLEPCEATCS